MWACDPALTSTIVDSYQGAGPLFVQTLQTFIAAHCALVGDHLWPDDATEEVIKDPNYDFIIVGAGSAGAVVANRLSEISNWKVLLIEAGGNPTLATEAPMLFYSNLGGSEDWSYMVEPQEGASRGFRNGRCVWPRGKVLGGCSSINGMFYVRGNRRDYDEWAAEGNYGWSFDDIFPYFTKSENFTGSLSNENEKYHEKEGYLPVQSGENMHGLEKLFLSGLQSIGINTLEDLNGPNQIGATVSQTTIHDGLRHSTARAFLSPIKNRTNLHVLKHALVTKILFEPNSNMVKGIILQKENRDITVYAKKEVVISAGAINTPQLLLLSGIGPKKELNNFKIEVKADLPVGEHLQDHLWVPLFFAMPGEDETNSLTNIATMLTDYVAKNSGPFSNTIPHRVIAFVNTTDATATTPDIEYHFIFYPAKSFHLVDPFDKLNLNDVTYKEFLDLNKHKSILVLYTTLLRPKSKGKIALKSINPKDHPIIHANYLSNIEDLHTIVRGLKYALRLNDTSSFTQASLELHWFTLEGCKEYGKASDDYLACVARELTFTLYHPTGTAKMGPDNDISAVVDPELRVRKVKGLRVIDASIMPQIVRGNTNAPVIMIGEKGADMIKKYWLNQHSEL